jgi:hypothetical protein
MLACRGPSFTSMTRHKTVGAVLSVKTDKQLRNSVVELAG